MIGDEKITIRNFRRNQEIEKLWCFAKASRRGIWLRRFWSDDLTNLWFWNLMHHKRHIPQIISEVLKWEKRSNPKRNLLQFGI